MELKLLNPRKALNKAFLKVKPNRTEIDNFKANLINLLDRTNDTESEEFHKNLVIDFLKKSLFDPNHYINTKGRNDLVIHNGNNAKSSVGVIVEAKKPTNKMEMVSTKKLNTKAFQELVLYYLRERITHKNLEVKHLIATNINEWFIFDATLFDRLFAQNKNLVKQFTEFEEGRLAENKTDFFYKQIAEPFIAGISSEIEFTYFNIQDYQNPLRNSDKKDDSSLISLFKLLSPEHLLKLPFANDSNSLNKRFYTELLHIIGLTETKEGSKKLIERNKPGERNSGTFMEDAIIQLDSLDKLSRLEKPNQYGSNTQERLFNVALELSITWINRILFLKLLEAQLITFHKGDKSYAFLNLEKIKNYDDLNSLFFQVLARKHSERNVDVKKAFENVPYLNSSLFEPTEVEQSTLFISNINDDKTIPVISSTVLKDKQGKKRSGSLSPLEYLFEFLNAYDFSGEGSEEIQEDNKTLINASVLGLIFEKINGYKDGSFFTPGFITMYMCHETIRKAVVQKFNEAKKWECKDIDELYDKIENRKEANEIINSLKICDPAVGSGHFLVSALNEIIAVKSDLKILQDREGKRLKEYNVEVVNDELIITDDEGELFEYSPGNKESQRIQEMLFHEKETIIENCLFGVDINSNSVKICRLRLWIELLKNAYYKNATELETLPNIDINIKCGNSLVSRFVLDSDLKQALKKSKWTIDSYKIAVETYRNAESKEQKREMEKLIADIKSDFRSEISSNDPKIKKQRKLSGELFQLTQQTQLFERNKKEKADWNKKVAQLTEEIKKLDTEIEEIKANKIFENAFEWRFEFPEVLNDDGDFVGFDVVMGNPPYIRVQEMPYHEIDYLKRNFVVGLKRIDISILFIELSKIISKKNGLTVYITSNQFLTTEYGEAARDFILNQLQIIKIIDFGDAPVFEEALTYVSIFIFRNSTPQDFEYTFVSRSNMLSFAKSALFDLIKIQNLNSDSWILKSQNGIDLLKKLEAFPKLQSIGKCWAGLFTGLDKVLMFDSKEIRKIDIETELLLPIIRAQDCEKYLCNKPSKYVIYPYKINNGRTVLLSENELREKFPRGYNYLINNKTLLANRKDSRKNLNDINSWFRLTRFGQKNIFEKPKIVSPGEVKSHKFCIDNSKAGFSCARVFAITIDNDKYDLYSIVAILNSSLLKYFIQSKASLKAGGYYSYSSKILNNVPIPKPDKLNELRLDELTLKIKNIKMQNPSAQTKEIEHQIDQMVYKLYDLTEEEIKIVEGK